MDLHQIISFPLYAGGILQIILGFSLLKRAPRVSRSMRAVAGLFFSAAVFALCTAISYTLESEGRSYNFFNRASWIGWFMIPACLQFAYYEQYENSRAARVVGYVLYPFWSLVLALTLLTDLVEPGDPSLIPYVNIDGPLENPARIVGTIQAIWLLVVLYRAKNRLQGVKKASFNLFFYGTLFFNLGCILIAGILPLFGAINPAFTTFFSLPWVVITYYAITRHHLFDLRLLVSRALNVTFLSLFFAGLHLGLFQLLSPALGNSLAILVSFAVIGLIFFGTQFSRVVQQKIQQLVLKDRYSYQEVLKESIQALVTILNQDELLTYLIQSIKKTFGVESLCLFLKMPDSKLAQLYGDGVFANAKQGVSLNNTVLEWLSREDRIVVREELEGAALPSDNGRTLASMTSLGAEMLIPLVYKGGFKGVIMLGGKGSGDSYVQSDIELLKSLAGHAVVAIVNAQLYDESRRLNVSYLESEEKFRTLAETAAVGIFIHQGGNFLYTNRYAEQVGGYSREEYLNLNFLSLTHPDYVEMIKARARERLAGGQAPPQYEFKIVRKDKEERWVLMTAGITTYEGKPAVIGTLIDITARKKAEEEREEYYRQLQRALLSLKESEARFRTLAETTSAGIFIHRGGKFIYANTAIKKITGYDAEEFLNLDFWALVHPDFRDMVRERGKARLKGALLPSQYEIKIIIRNGEERWGNLTAGSIEFEGAPAVVVTFFDITDRKQTEAERLKLYEENLNHYQARIEEEQRHQSEKEKILRDLHDGIGGITTNISLLADMAKNATAEPQVRTMLGTISELSREGIAEIRSFLHSLDSRDMTWQSLAAELRNQGSTMVDPHGIFFDLTTSISGVPGRPGSLLSMNLYRIYKESLTNIIKHSKAKTIYAALTINGEELRLSIQDDGIGLAHGRPGGRGLLNMKTRAEEIGGRIMVTTGQGTLITLTIPIPLKYPAQGIEPRNPI